MSREKLATKRDYFACEVTVRDRYIGKRGKRWSTQPIEWMRL